jgi:hypothetical protein
MFIRSAAVRQKYSAPMIITEQRNTDGAFVLGSDKKADQDYADFPLKMVHHYRKSAARCRRARFNCGDNR